ncbi:MAG: adenylate/guanylate cyclase domain-containing protein [Desulfobacterales bacterium]|nr:adenylate/guanylate cyclase domain-containing protein [Desulfobacterales bacterium]
MKRIRILLVAVNLIGGCATFFYFKYILPPRPSDPGVPGYYDAVFFLVTMLFLSVSFFLLKRRSVCLLGEISDGKKEISDFSPDMAHYLQRESLKLPMVLSLLSFGMWIVAGFIFGFLEPLVSSRIFSTAPPDLVFCLRWFLGISVLGGGVTCLVLFFMLDNAWRPHTMRFFPKGRLKQVKYGFGIRLRTRFILVFMGIVCIPMPIVGAILMSNIRQLHTADAVTRNELISSLYWEMGYVTADLLIIALILAYLLAKSIIGPLQQIKATVKAVEKNDFTRQVPVMSNDELGDVAQGVNAMVDSLYQSQKARDSLGRYMCSEIREQIMSGADADLSGEMKRVTLLFSDLRGFTGLVEKNHPRDVVKILNQYFNEMTLAVKAHKGLILQYVGDEIEAVFGAPVGYDDHPEMAVQAALEMRQRLERLNRKFADQGFPQLAHGIGIHSGAVLAGNIGSEERMSYALVGDTVNTASRIEGLAKTLGADIVLSQTTHSLLTGSYPTEQLPPVRVKGKDEEVIVYKLKLT